MEALEEELNGTGTCEPASYVPAYNAYDLNAPVPPASSKPTKYQDLDPWHKAQTHNEWELLQRRLADKLHQPAVAKNAKLQQELTLQYRRKEEECLRYHLNQQVIEQDNARALASTIRNIHRSAPEELGEVIQSLCRDLAYEFLSAFEAPVDPDFPWKATCEGTKQQFASIIGAGRDAPGEDHTLDAQAYLIGYFECIARLVEQPSTVMGQQFRTIAGAVLGRHPFGTVIQRFVTSARYLCTEIRANRLPLSVIVNLVRAFVVVMRDAWFTAWKDANRACRGKLHEFFAIAIQHVVFLRCSEIEALFAEPTAQAVSIDDRLHDLYEHCAVPEAWRVVPPHAALTNGESHESLLELLPHTPYERPTQELRVLAQAKTPLEIVAVLHRTVDLIMEVCGTVDSSVRHLAADDVIPLLSLCFNLSIRHPTMGLDPGLLRTKFRFCDTFLPDHLANGAHGYILTIAQTGMHTVT